MDIPAPLALLLQALEAGDLPAAKAAARELQHSRTGDTRLAAEVLHELRQPLLGLKAYTQLLSEELGSRGTLQMMLAQVERMEQIISDFTRLVSERPAPQQPVSLAAHVRAAAQHFALNPDSARISLEVVVSEEPTLQGNGRLLEQLTLNLLNNARDAISGPGRVKVVVAREGDAPVLYVADWGPGVPELMRQHLFEPYVTGNKHGTGLGLAVCQRIAQEHHARLELVPPSMLPEQPPPTTLFRILFPPPEAAPALVDASLPPATSSSPRRRMLVVDDEAIIRNVFKDLMGRECEVLEATDAEQALAQLQREPVELIVTDKNLPGRSGLELARQARQLDARSRVILMTGYPSVVTTQQALELGLLDYLLKPFDDIRQVRARLREALAGAPLSHRELRAGHRRVDVLEDSPSCARQVAEALARLGLEARVVDGLPERPEAEAPAAVVVSWDFGPARGRQALELARRLGPEAPVIMLAEHLTQETVLEALRAGAAGCLPRHLPAQELAPALSRILGTLPGENTTAPSTS